MKTSAPAAAPAYSLLFHKNSDDEYLQCSLLSQCCQGITFESSFVEQSADYPCYPVLLFNGKTIFGVNNIARYFASEGIVSSHFEDLLDIEEFQIRPNCNLLLSQKISWEGKKSPRTPIDP
jgi:hypothetical protein